MVRLPLGCGRVVRTGLAAGENEEGRVVLQRKLGARGSRVVSLARHLTKSPVHAPGFNVLVEGLDAATLLKRGEDPLIVVGASVWIVTAR